MNKYQVVLYEEPNGKSQIKTWLHSLKQSSPTLYTKARWMLKELLGSKGPDLKTPHAKHIGGKIWELRHKSGIRIYYWRQDYTVFVAAAGEVKKQSQGDQGLIAYANSAYREYNSEE